jgi:hypothetical protein
LFSSLPLSFLLTFPSYIPSPSHSEGNREEDKGKKREARRSRERAVENEAVKIVACQIEGKGRRGGN